MRSPRFRLYVAPRPERLKWRLVGLVNRLPGQCWAGLVSYPLGRRRWPWASQNESCRADLARCGACYCGKLRAAAQRRPGHLRIEGAPVETGFRPVPWGSTAYDRLADLPLVDQAERGSTDVVCRSMWNGWVCTRPPGHAGTCRASDGLQVLAEWHPHDAEGEAL